MEIDAFGFGTRFTVSQHAPSIGIVYKIAQYGGRGIYKTLPDKATLPGRKTVVRKSEIKDLRFEMDLVQPLDAHANDLLRPFDFAEPVSAIQQRLQGQLAALPDAVKAIQDPKPYPVEFTGFPHR